MIPIVIEGRSNGADLLNLRRAGLSPAAFRNHPTPVEMPGRRPCYGWDSRAPVQGRLTEGLVFGATEIHR